MLKYEETRNFFPWPESSITRFLLEVGHLEAGEEYCGLLGDKGKELLSEYNNSMTLFS